MSTDDPGSQPNWKLAVPNWYLGIPNCQFLVAFLTIKALAPFLSRENPVHPPQAGRETGERFNPNPQ